MARETFERWLLNRRADNTDGAPLIRIDPNDNVLVGWPAISAYLRISSYATLYKWVELYGFPAIKRPDGMWMTTMTSIDQWLFIACEVDNANRKHSRGSNARYDIALQRLQNRISDLRESGEARGPVGPKPD